MKSYAAHSLNAFMLYPSMSSSMHHDPLPDSRSVQTLYLSCNPPDEAYQLIIEPCRSLINEPSEKLLSDCENAFSEKSRR